MGHSLLEDCLESSISSELLEKSWSGVDWRWGVSSSTSLSLSSGNLDDESFSTVSDHCKILYYSIWNGLIKGLEINPNNADEEFCQACAAEKPTMQPFLKESLTHTSDFGESPLGPMGTSKCKEPWHKVLFHCSKG